MRSFWLIIFYGFAFVTLGYSKPSYSEDVDACFARELPKELRKFVSRHEFIWARFERTKSQGWSEVDGTNPTIEDLLAWVERAHLDSGQGQAEGPDPLLMAFAKSGLEKRKLLKMANRLLDDRGTTVEAVNQFVAAIYRLAYGDSLRDTRRLIFKSRVDWQDGYLRARVALPMEQAGVIAAFRDLGLLRDQNRSELVLTGLKRVKEHVWFAIDVGFSALAIAHGQFGQLFLPETHRTPEIKLSTAQLARLTESGDFAVLLPELRATYGRSLDFDRSYAVARRVFQANLIVEILLEILRKKDEQAKEAAKKSAATAQAVTATLVQGKDVVEGIGREADADHDLIVALEKKVRTRSPKR